jgi:hypothetical protein
MRNVISLALFGQDSKYSQYLSSVTRAWKALLPDFEIWVHHDDLAKMSSYWPFLQALAERQVIKPVAMGTAPLTKAMLWRIAPLWEPEVEYVFARDIDALPTPRERECMVRFMASGLVVSEIHDHNQHCLLMGGLCGFHAPKFRTVMGGRFPDLQAFYRLANFTNEQWEKHGYDQHALNRIVAPTMSKQGFIYEHRWSGWAEGKPGPPSGRTATYRGGISEPVPDVVTVLERSPGWVHRAEQLVHHLGQAGYDQQRAVDFYDIDDSPWNVLIRAAEKETR